MSDTGPPPPNPDDSEEKQGAEDSETSTDGDEATPAPPEPKEPLDFKATPSGVRPAVWKDLPPPEIVRAEPEPEKRAGERIREFFQSRAGKQGAIGLGALILIFLLIQLFSPKATLASHYGALRMFTTAIEDRDAEAMRVTCGGIAAMMCDGILAQISEMELAAQASPFANARYEVGGAGEGAQQVSAIVTCEGENGDDFLRINMNLRRQEDGTWRIVEMGTQTLE